MWVGVRTAGLVLLMRVYEPNKKDKILERALREINILKRNFLTGRPSEKATIDSLDKIEKLLKKLAEDENA